MKKITIILGSTRNKSIHLALAKKVKNLVHKKDIEVNLPIELMKNIPLYCGDFESAHGLPENIQELIKEIVSSDGLIVIGPEYNGSVTPQLKNIIDWLSRANTNTLNFGNIFFEKMIIIMSSSPGKFGGIYSLSHLRDILTILGAIVLPTQVAIGGISEPSDFDTMGEREFSLLKTSIKSLIQKI